MSDLMSDVGMNPSILFIKITPTCYCVVRVYCGIIEIDINLWSTFMNLLELPTTRKGQGYVFKQVVRDWEYAIYAISDKVNSPPHHWEVVRIRVVKVHPEWTKRPNSPYLGYTHREVCPPITSSKNSVWVYENEQEARKRYYMMKV